jgi:NAD(P)-dependent dehydrogenase (short-subunit alcohol dehydrogenase family)
MSKTVLITGTNKGIGFALTREFLKNDYKVFGTCRPGRESNFNNDNFQSAILDLANFDSINEFENSFRRENIKLDILINNAGIGPDLDFTLPEQASFKQTFEVNVIGTTFFTEQMLIHIKRGGKIINISSKMGSTDTCELTDAVAYRMSKTALNMYTKLFDK